MTRAGWSATAITLWAVCAAGCGGKGAAGPAAPAAGPGHAAAPLTEADVEMPKTFAAGCDRLAMLAASIGAHAEAGTLAKVHRVAEEASLVANRMVELAQAEVPAEKRADATKACRAIAAMFPDFDKAGDGGDKPGVVRLVGVLRGHVEAARTAAGVKAAAAGAGVAIDPVCHMEVEIAPDALQHVHEGKTYYFCNDQCVERFKAKPGDFLK